MKKATAALLGILLLAGCSDGGGGIFSGWGASCEMTHFQPVENTGQLLKQLYDYPKSCMSELEAKHDELEKIWGVTVYSIPFEEKFKQFENRTKCENRLDGIALYVKNYGMVLETNDCYKNKFGGFNTDETLVGYLPEADMSVEQDSMLVAWHDPIIPKNPGESPFRPKVAYPVIEMFRFSEEETKDNYCADNGYGAILECRTEKRIYTWKNRKSGIEIRIDVNSGDFAFYTDRINFYTID
ncbi:hypothetical protein [Neisseria elongata]|uniref:hypothetical protein n=1 Tax=Neisseria elongata TaxID=495 RepID=UPI000668A491|nr:hypothetical protein [Neisseria elongata]